ncbi:MAG: dihydrolipoamide acetyltransferase family protein [Myxococcales bacterium]
MSVQIQMPELSTEGEGATLATWLVAVGDHVEKGDVIAELETDKSTVELEAPATGTVTEFRVQEGTEGIAAGVILGILDAVASSVSSAPSEPASDETQVDELAQAAGAAHGDSNESSTAHGSDLSSAGDSDLRASTPLARRAAADRDVDVASLAGSGPGGRVLEEDVLRSAQENAEADLTEADDLSRDVRIPEVEISGSFEKVRLSAMRKTIARRMTEAKQRVPHFYLRARCAMDAVIEVRAKLNQDLAAEGLDLKISVNDFIVRASALALRDVPDANVSFAGHEMHVFKDVDICVAVATEGGLVAPVLRNADRKGLSALAREVKELAGLARSGKLRPEQYQGGSFTISNLGMYGVETVYPILNPPQACILGVGAAEEQPVVRDGAIVVGRVASFALAADHRAVDGAVAARFLAALRARLEDPLCMML